MCRLSPGEKGRRRLGNYGLPSWKEVWSKHRQIAALDTERADKAELMCGCETSLARSAIRRALVMSQGLARPEGLIFAQT